MPLKLALALAAAQAAPAADLDATLRPQLEAASQAVLAGRSAEGLDALAPILAAYDARNAAEKRAIVCGMTGEETLLYLVKAANEKKSTVAIGPGYCQALYLRGFALFDLGRIMEARAAYEHAVALAPMHSHYLVELGQTYRMTKDWDRMLSICRQAGDAANIAPPDAKKREQGFALRCQGYALVEQGKLDAAGALYRQCLVIDPADGKAQNELKYIAQQRAKPSA